MTEDLDDERRWVAAQALLERSPTEARHRREARARYDRRVLRFAVGLLCAAVVLALVLLVVDPPPEHGDPPAWRVGTGIAVAVLGLVLMGGRLARPYGSPSRLADPLNALSRRQRAALFAHVQGRGPVPTDRMPLVRRAAEWALEQPTTLLLQAGVATAYLGTWIAHRSIFTTVMALAFTTLVVGAGVVAIRHDRHARRFLAEHPAPDGG